MDKAGWLKKQLDQVEQEIKHWPDWKRESTNQPQKTSEQTEAQFHTNAKIKTTKTS